MYCKDCKYWIRLDKMAKPPRYQWDDLFGECGCIKFRDVNEMATGKSWDTRRNLPTNDMLLSWDNDGYAAGCYVGQDFGCVHFEEGVYERATVSEDENEM